MVGRGRSHFAILLSILLLILLIQVLPQVDLPATAFCRNSEPLTVHAAIAASPLVLMFKSAVHSMPPDGRESLHVLFLTVSSATTRKQPEHGLRC